MKRILSLLLCVAVLGGLTGCSEIEETKSLPEESPVVISKEPEPLSSGEISSEDSSLTLEKSVLEQAQQLAACLIQYGLTVDARQTCEITDEVIWHFVNGSNSCKQDFPYPVWPEVNESRTTAYFRLSDLQQMVEQVFGVADWMPDVVKDHCDASGTRLELPLEVGLFGVYGYEEMRSTALADGSIAVTFQLIDTPNFPGDKRYGAYTLTFTPMQDSGQKFLRLTGFTKSAASESSGSSAKTAYAGENSSETVSLQEPPLTEADWETPLPDFLDETQQELYLRAKVIYSALSVDTTNIDSFFDGTLQGESVEINGTRYRISNGRYAKWEDFIAMMRSLFTEECIAHRLGTDLDEPTFLEHDGQLCYIDAARGSLPGHLEPDEYELISKTEEEITFNLIGHYVPLGGGEVYTESFPVRMVYTEDGWRFAEFNLTL